MTRNILRSAVENLIFSLFALAPVAPGAERPPNVILIVADDLGYADVGVYGAKGFATPNLDRLAQEGIRFTDFHVAQAVCSASRAALMTGCYPNRVGIEGAMEPWYKFGIHENELTMPKMMKQKGYATGMVGKWHLGTPAEFLPTHRGFDEWFGLPYSNDQWPLHPEKPGKFPPLPLYDGDKVINPNLSHRDMEQLTTQYTERAVSFIERNHARPFFLYVAHTMPHVPLAVSDKFRGTTKRGLYGDAVEEVDWGIGEILAALKSTISKRTRSSCSCPTTARGSFTEITPAPRIHCAKARRRHGMAARACPSSHAGRGTFPQAVCARRWRARSICCQPWQSSWMRNCPNTKLTASTSGL